VSSRGLGPLPSGCGVGCSSSSRRFRCAFFPGDRAAAGPAPLHELVGARNQHVSLQLALRSSSRLEGVTAECRPLEGPAGTLAADARLSAVEWYPDPLVDLPLTLEPQRTRAVWATIHLPKDAPAGSYRSAVLVRHEGREIARVPFRLRVAAAEVPAERSLRVTNWFRVDDRHAKQFWDAPQFEGAWWNVVGNLARVMAEYRQSVVLTPTLDLVELLPGEEPRFGFDRFDRWVETFQRAGAIGFIEGEHLDEKGWKPIYLQHVLDEPHPGGWRRHSRAGTGVRQRTSGPGGQDIP